MRKILMAAAIAVAAAALNACNPRELTVKDNSELKGVTLVISNEDGKWEFGEDRFFTIAVTPSTAICDRFELKVSNPEIVIVNKGEMPNQFRLTANGEGKLIVTALAAGHGANGPVEFTTTEEFKLEDNRVKPVKPVVTARIAPSTDLDAKKIIADDAPFVTDSGLDLLFSVSSDEEKVTFLLKSGSPKVLSVERTGQESWLLKTLAPGQNWLYLTATDKYGNVFDFAYLVYAFGHLTFEADYNPVWGHCGFNVSEHSYGELTAQVYMTGELFGWPWNDVNNVASCKLPIFNDVVDITSEFEYEDLMETDEAQNYLYGMYAGEGSNRAPFTPHRVKMNYIVTLSNPYILLELLDDSSREESKYWNFTIEAALQQEGVAEL